MKQRQRQPPRSNGLLAFLAITNPLTWVMGIGVVIGYVGYQVAEGWIKFWDLILVPAKK